MGRMAFCPATDRACAQRRGNQTGLGFARSRPPARKSVGDEVRQLFGFVYFLDSNLGFGETRLLSERLSGKADIFGARSPCSLLRLFARNDPYGRSGTQLQWK
jgi:hypothetical protein